MHEHYDDPFEDIRHEWSYSRIRIAQETGWTLDYIDTLSYADVAEFWAVFGGHQKVLAHRAQIARDRRKSRGRYQ